MTTPSVAGKVVVVTGASSGFGKGTALELARQGASVVVAARRGQLIGEVAQACRAAGARAVAVPTDVSQPRQVERLAQNALNAFQRIDVWINNAGVGALGPFERVSLGDHTQVIATTLLGTLYGSYFAYRQFLAQGAGILINVTSELGRHTVPCYASYAAAKHGVVALSDSLRQEVAQQGRSDVHVCLVMPTALHDPQDVIDTLVRLVADPKDTEIVGADGVIEQMEDAPPAGDTPGTVQAPTPEGRGISAGQRKAS